MPYSFPLRVNQGHNLPSLSVVGLRDVFIIIRQKELVCKSVTLCQKISQTQLVSQSFRFCQSVRQTLLVSQKGFVTFSVRLCQLANQTLPVSQSDLVKYSVKLCVIFSFIFSETYYLLTKFKKGKYIDTKSWPPPPKKIIVFNK